MSNNNDYTSYVEKDLVLTLFSFMKDAELNSQCVDIVNKLPVVLFKKFGRNIDIKRYRCIISNSPLYGFTF